MNPTQEENPAFTALLRELCEVIQDTQLHISVYNLFLCSCVQISGGNATVSFFNQTETDGTKTKHAFLSTEINWWALPSTKKRIQHAHNGAVMWMLKPQRYPPFTIEGKSPDAILPGNGAKLYRVAKFSLISTGSINCRLVAEIAGKTISVDDKRITFSEDSRTDLSIDHAVTRGDHWAAERDCCNAMVGLDIDELFKVFDIFNTTPQRNLIYTPRK